MILLIATLIEAREFGWSNSWIRAAISARGAVGPVVLIIEAQVEDADASSFLVFESVFSWVSFAVLLGSAAFFGMLFVRSLFSAGRGYTPCKPAWRCCRSHFLPRDRKPGIRTAAQQDPSNGPDARCAAFRLIGFAAIVLADHGLLLSVTALPLLLIGLGAGLSNPMALRDAATIDKKYSGITSGIATATATWSGRSAWRFSAHFLADAHRIVDGARIAAPFSTASTALIVLMRGNLWRPTRPHGASNRISSERR